MRATPPPPPNTPSPLELLTKKVQELERLLSEKEKVRDEPYTRPKRKGTVFLYLEGVLHHTRVDESKRIYSVLNRYTDIESLFLKTDEHRMCVGYGWCKVRDLDDVDYVLRHAREIYEKSGIIVKPCSIDRIPTKAYHTMTHKERLEKGNKY